MCSDLSYMPSSSHSLLHSHFLFQEVELFEACYYGLMGQVHYLLTTGVNVNVALFVSEFCIYVLQYCAHSIVHVQRSLLRSVLLHACWVSHFICLILMSITWYVSVSDYLYYLPKSHIHTRLDKVPANTRLHKPKHDKTQPYMHACMPFTHTCTQKGGSLLFLASQEGQDEIVEMLLQAGATVDLQRKVKDCCYDSTLFICRL